MGGAGVTVTTATIRGQRHLGCGAKQTQTQRGAVTGLLRAMRSQPRVGRSLARQGGPEQCMGTTAGGRPSSYHPPPKGPKRGQPTYCGFPHADPRLRHWFGRFCFNHLGCRGHRGPGLLGLQGQLIGHLEGLPQRQDDLVGESLGEDSMASAHRVQSLPPRSSPPRPKSILTGQEMQNLPHGDPPAAMALCLSARSW